jgi:hypothetical protein
LSATTAVLAPLPPSAVWQRQLQSANKQVEPFFSGMSSEFTGKIHRDYFIGSTVPIYLPEHFIV